MRNNFEYAGRIGKVARKAVVLGAAVLTVAGALVGSNKASATASGLTFYPSTDVYSKGNFHFDSDTFFDQNPSKGSVFSSIGLEYGTGPDKDGAFGRSELGFDIATNYGSGVNFGERLQFNAKTQIYNSDSSQTRVVAGVWGLGSKKLSSPNVIYLTGAKTFEFGRVHLGVAHSLAKSAALVTPRGNDDKTYLTVGYDKVFGNGKFQFTTDYYSGKSNISALAPAVIYYMNDKSDFQLGYIKYNDSSLRDTVYLGFDYNFGGSTPPTAEAPPAPETSTTAPAVN